MTRRFRDGTIVCTPHAVKIHLYYFPWGTKTIPYSSIRDVRKVDLGTFTGRFRLWGTANPRYWVSLDVTRPCKKHGLILDTGRFIKPFITPRNVDAVAALIRQNAGLTPPAPSSRAPIL